MNTSLIEYVLYFFVIKEMKINLMERLKKNQKKINLIEVK